MAPGASTSVRAEIGYAPAGTVVADEERPGLLRSPTRDRATPNVDGGVTCETCTIHDLDAVEEPPGFVAAGFEAIRLPEMTN